LADARQGSPLPGTLERLTSLEAERSALQQRVAALEAQTNSSAGRSNLVAGVSGRDGIQPKAVDGDAEAAAWVAQARAAAAAGRWREAESAYRRALAHSVRDLSLLSGLGSALVAQGKLEEASTALEAVVTARPRDAEAVRSLGVVRLRQQRNDEALMFLSRAAELDPGNPEVYCLLGKVMMRKGLSDPAELTLRRALDLRPGYGEAHQTLALVYALRLPPALEPGRRHYALAVAAGMPADPHLERLLELDATNAARADRRQ
jgi:Flp pilus assembly protein TadD